MFVLLILIIYLYIFYQIIKNNNINTSTIRFLIYISKYNIPQLINMNLFRSIVFLSMLVIASSDEELSSSSVVITSDGDGGRGGGRGGGLGGGRGDGGAGHTTGRSRVRARNLRHYLESSEEWSAWEYIPFEESSSSE